MLLDHVGVAGGAERYWRVVLPALRGAGRDVQVLVRSASDRPGFEPDPLTIPWGGDDGAACVSAAMHVRSILRARRGTVITASVFDPAVLDVVRAEADRWLVRVHDHRPFCPNGDRVFPQFSDICTHAAGWSCALNTVVHGCMNGPRPASFARLAQRLAVRDRLTRADAILVSSGYMYGSAVNNRLDPRRIVITPPPLTDAAYAQPIVPRPVRDTVLFSGRITPQKGVQSLVRAIARIPGERRPALVIAGSGADEPAARALAVRLGVAADWRGWLGTRALRAAIDEATVVAVPSLEPEPFGLVGIEAQARGRPAVAYDVGGISDWIEGAGTAVARGDERAFAAALLDALVPETWARTSRAARRASERYRLRPHLERILDLTGAGSVTAAAVATRAERAPTRPRFPVRPNRPVVGTPSSGS